MLVKSIKVDWSWSGDTTLLRGFNVAVCVDGDVPTDKVVVQSYTTTVGVSGDYTFTFNDVTLQDGVDYRSFVQAVYEGKDSSWVSSGGFSVVDDGTATISNASLTTEDILTGAGWSLLPSSGADVTDYDAAAATAQAIADLAEARAAYNLFDMSEWTVGNSLPMGGFTYYGSDTTFTNEVKYMAGPFGTNVPVLEMVTLGDQTSASWAGGFKYDITGAKFSVNRTYRFTCWVKRPTNNNSFYLGWDAMWNLGTETANSNPYSFSSYEPPTADKWYLLVAVIHGTNYADATKSGMSGWYDPVTGKMVGSEAGEFRLISTDISFYVRLAQYRTPDGCITQVYSPMMQVLDGSETPISALLMDPSNIDQTFIGLPNVEDKSSADIRSELTSDDILSGASWTTLPEDGADVTDYTSTLIANSISDSNVLTIARPLGASYFTPSASAAGAIVVVLPVSWTNTMMKMTIDVYTYLSSRAFSLEVGGYNYDASALWANTTANLIGSTLMNNRVRFGHDGTHCVIVIGETTSTWAYPNIAVKNFQASYSNFTVDMWDDGWDVILATDLTGYTFTSDHADSLIDAKAIINQGALATSDDADWSTQISGIGKPADNADVTKDTIEADLVVGSGGIRLDGGSIRSGNYVAGSSGWSINADGTAELRSATIRGSLSADDLTTGDIRGINVTAASHSCKGSFLTAAASEGATTLTLHNTDDFDTSGSGWIFSADNDKDTFTWTGKTATTLTGCSGVLAHVINSAIAPQAPNVIMDSESKELRVYGYNTTANTYSTVEQLVTMGIKDVGDGGVGSIDEAIMRVGNETFSRGLAAYFENNDSDASAVRIRNYNSSIVTPHYGLSVYCKDLSSVKGYGGIYSEGNIAVVGVGVATGMEGQGEYGVKGFCMTPSEDQGTIGNGFGVYGHSGSYGRGGVYGYCNGVGPYGVSGDNFNPTANPNWCGGDFWCRDGRGVQSAGDVYDYYASGSGTNYAPFTGSHDGILLDGEIEQGDIVIDIETAYRKGVSDTISTMRRSSASYQSSVVGVYVTDISWHTPTVVRDNMVTFSGFLEELVKLSIPESVYAAIYRDVTPDNFEEMRDRLFNFIDTTTYIAFNSIGEGQINVCCEGGDLEVGDYICSSNTAGKGMKQNDDVLHSYTVAKSREAVTWTQEEIDNNVIKMVACTYHCG